MTKKSYVILYIVRKACGLERSTHVERVADENAAARGVQLSADALFWRTVTHGYAEGDKLVSIAGDRVTHASLMDPGRYIKGHIFHRLHVYETHFIYTYKSCPSNHISHRTTISSQTIISENFQLSSVSSLDHFCFHTQKNKIYRNGII